MFNRIVLSVLQNDCHVYIFTAVKNSKNLIDELEFFNGTFYSIKTNSRLFQLDELYHKHVKETIV